MKTTRLEHSSCKWSSLLIAGCILLPVSAIASNDTNECWISARTNLLGTGFIFGNGAITNPFYGDFDAIIQSLPAYTTIHLLPGIHFTKGYTAQAGDTQLAAYQRVIGAGLETTIVRRDTNFNHDIGPMSGVFYSTADGVEVRDLTVDPNASGTETHKQQATSLSGNYSKVQRVRAINTSGTTTAERCFSVSVAGTRSEVSEVEVSSVQGSYCTAVTLFSGASEFVENCRVVFPTVTNGSTVFRAYQAQGTYDALFDRNISEAGTVGFYTDTLSETNLTVINNIYQNVWYGVVINKTTSSGYNVDGVAIRNNFIEISTSIPSGQGYIGYGILATNQDTTGSVVYRNVAIVGDTIRTYSNGATLPGTYAIVAKSAVITNYLGVRVLENTLDKSFAFLWGAQNTWLANNTDLAGAPLQFRIVDVGSPSSVTLNPIDGTVIVLSSTTTSLTLPTAKGFKGKELLIKNDNSTSFVHISPARGESILPSGSRDLDNGTTLNLVSDGSSTWLNEN